MVGQMPEMIYLLRVLKAAVQIGRLAAAVALFLILLVLRVRPVAAVYRRVAHRQNRLRLHQAHRRYLRQVRLRQVQLALLLYLL